MKRSQIGICIACALVLFASPRTQAKQYDNPPPLPGWTHATKFSPDDSPQLHGIVLEGKPVVRSAPVIGEIDGNTGDGKEVAIGTSDGTLYAYRSDGSKLWGVPISDGCPATEDSLASTPAVGTIFGDGVPYVVVGYGTANANCDGGVVALRGDTGALAWRFSLKAWEVQEGYSPESLHGVRSSPALADTDGDGKMEIGFGGLDRNIYLLNADGSVRWYYHAADTVFSSPAFVNIDADAPLEMIIGSDVAGNTRIKPPTSDGGYVYAFDTQTRTPKRQEFQAKGAYLWRSDFDQSIYSSPAIADVLSSNPGSEIIVGAACYYPSGQPDKRGKWLKVLKLSDGTVLKTFDAPACVQSSPAVGDLDDDGNLDVVANVSGATAIGGTDNKGRIVAWNPETGRQLWSMIPTSPNDGANDPYVGDLQSPVIADVDGNGSLEVVTANFWTVEVINGKTGAQLTCENNDTCGTQTSLFAWGTVKSTPAVGDINGDGVLDVVMGGEHVFNGGKGMLYAWTNLAGKIASPVGAQKPYSAPWPMFRGDANHTGVLSVPLAPSLRVSSTAMSQLVGRTDSPSTFDIALTNPSTEAITWRATSDQPWLTIATASGSATSAAPSTLTITVNPAGLAVNSYAGTVTVTSAAGTQTVNVTLVVAEQVYRQYLPLSVR